MRPITKITIFGVRLGVIALFVYWGIIFVGTHIPEIPDAAPEIDDKVLHFLAFFGLTFCLCYVSKPRPRLQRFGRIAVIALAYAAIDELTQTLVRGRQADWLDFFADAAGIGSAISFYIAAQLIFQRFTAARSANVPETA